MLALLLALLCLLVCLLIKFFFSLFFFSSSLFLTLLAFLLLPASFALLLAARHSRPSSTLCREVEDNMGGRGTMHNNPSSLTLDLGFVMQSVWLALALLALVGRPAWQPSRQLGRSRRVICTVLRVFDRAQGQVFPCWLAGWLKKRSSHQVVRGKTKKGTRAGGAAL